MPSDDSRPPAPPRPVPQNRGRPFVLVGCSIVLGAVLLFVVTRLDRGTSTAKDDAPTDVIEVFPDELTKQEIAAGAAGDRPPQQDVGEVQEGWIQITDDEGKLAQQYRFDRLDPNPEGMGAGWFHMDQPQFEIYMSGGRVLRLTGTTALVYRPHQFIESGELRGDVVIHQFEDVDDRTVGETDQPSMAVRTTSAQFDNILGEVRCPDEITVETRTGEFLGRRLKLLINDQEDVIKLLRIDEVDFIRFATAEMRPREETAAPVPKPEKRDRPRRNRQRPRGGAADAPSADPAKFYRLTLHDNVRIRQGEGDTAREVMGDALDVVFSFESEGIGPTLAFGPPPPPKRIAAVRPARPEVVALWAAIGAPPVLRIAPPSDPERDAFVTCNGGLTMEPIDDPGLPSPKHARMVLHGDPVKLVDPGAQAEVTCDQLRYLMPEGRLELVRSDVHPLHIESPELIADGEVFWLGRNGDEGGFEGPGALCVRDAGEGAEPIEQLRIDWSEGVDLAFVPSDDATGMSGLRSARFRGDIQAQSRNLTLPGADGETPQEPTAGRLSSRSFEVFFAESGAGATTIERIHASGDVAITDEEQQLWAQELDARLQTAAETDGTGKTALDKLVAEGDVQVLLAGGERVLADRLDVDGPTQTAIISGEEVRLIDGNSIIDRAKRIEIHEGETRYVLEGRGQFRQFDGPLLDPDADPREPRTRTGLDVPAGRREELRMSWSDGVVIAPREGAAADAERQPLRAAFTGDVEIITPDLRLAHADAMDVDMTRDETAGETVLEHIAARGNVSLQSVADPGDIRCDRFDVAIGHDDEGRVIPKSFTATGNVHVADHEQDLWTDALLVTFRARPDDPVDAATSELEVSSENPFADARIEPDGIVADGAVQLRLPDGERVFARRLEASAPRESAVLSGPDIVIVGEAFVLDRIDRLDVDRTSGEYSVDGRGRFTAFAEPLLSVPSRERLTPPALAGERTLEATWSQSATYADGGDGTGTLAIVGEVRAESRPDALEINNVEAQRVELDFIELPGATDADAAQRALGRVVASGDARLESRVWPDASRSGAARVYYVAGARIEYDERSMEAIVDGAGELLIRDPGDDPDAAAEPGRFAADGTTLFRWTERLEMIRIVDERYRITMRGDVTIIHKDPTQRTSTVTGQLIETIVDRRPVDEAQRAERALHLGGSMTPVRVVGRDGITVRTPERDVACDAFDYNPQTGIAEISAAPGRMVSILTTGSARPFKAERALWNMTPGSESVTILRGGAATGAP